MIHIVLGSFFGDEGKGQTVHNLCRRYSAGMVIRFSGGHQVGHTVRYGELEHTFSNFGSGSFLGIPTYWSEYCTVDPITTLAELEDLNKLKVYPEIYYSPLCQVATPFDVIEQWNNEDNLRHGTVGTGYKSVLDRVAKGYSLTIADCRNLFVLRTKMLSMMVNYWKTGNSAFPSINLDEWCLKVYHYFDSVKLLDIRDITLGDCVFEGSQGILLDQRFGIMPYCTPSNTTCQNAIELISRTKYNDVVINNVYVTRPYITRHGNGPIPTDKEVIPVSDPNNGFNEFQKTLRAAKFDYRLFQHSISINETFQSQRVCCRGAVITHADEITDEFRTEFNKLPQHFLDTILTYTYENVNEYSIATT